MQPRVRNSKVYLDWGKGNRTPPKIMWLELSLEISICVPDTTSAWRNIQVEIRSKTKCRCVNKPQYWRIYEEIDKGPGMITEVHKAMFIK